jgi:hypothetical protein
MEDIIHRFLSGNLRLAKKRTFTPVPLGGLGLFGVENFISAQKTTWIRRCKIIDKEWKIILIRSGAGNITYIMGRTINADEFPVLHEIGSCYDKFREKFTGTDNNFLSAHLINNPALTIGIRSRDCLTFADIAGNNQQANLREPGPDPDPPPPNIVAILKNLKINDLLVGEYFITKLSFQQRVGIRIDAVL